MSKQTSSNIKIALLVLGAIAIGILGINFLKGNKIIGSNPIYTSTFDDGGGLRKSHKVMLNGVQVGKVESVDLIDNLQRVRVKYSLDRGIKLPDDSKVAISPGFGSLATPSLQVEIGNSSETFKPGSTISSFTPKSITNQAESILDDLEPSVASLKSTLNKLDSTATSLNTILGGQNAKNIESSIANLEVTMRNFNAASQNLKATSEKVDVLIDEQSIKLDNMISNLNSITNNLKENQHYIDNALKNFSETSDELASLELKETLDRANETVAKLNSMLDKINNGNGSLSLLLNDAELYNNLNNAARDLDRLILDIKEDPSEVVPDISIFGKKKKKK